MRPFEFTRVRDLDDALTQLAMPGARALAGGTTLVDLMKLGVEAPERLVDISDLPLAGIVATKTSLRIGALASNSAVASDPSVQRYFPAISQALLSGASGQIRNAASIGGNLLQRTRCSYFRSTDWPCNKRVPGSGCSARDGVHAGHAVLGTSTHCIAVNPSDVAVGLLALDAQVHLNSTGGSRSVPLADFYRLPGETPEIETVLTAGELVTGIEVPFSPLGPASRYLKLRGRASYEFASASVAAAVLCEHGIVTDVAIALGGLGVVPWRNRQAESLLVGQELSDSAIDALCDALLAEAAPTPDNAYKLPLARGAIHRTLRRSAGC